MNIIVTKNALNVYLPSHVSKPPGIPDNTLSDRTPMTYKRCTIYNKKIFLNGLL